MQLRSGYSSAPAALRSGLHTPRTLLALQLVPRHPQAVGVRHPLLGVAQLRLMSSISADDLKGGAKTADKGEQEGEGEASCVRGRGAQCRSH